MSRGYYQEHKDKIKEYGKKYCQRPKVKSRTKKYNKTYRKKNRIKLLLQSRKYEKKNKEKRRQYAQKNKEVNRKSQRKYREKNKNNPKFKEHTKDYMKKWRKKNPKKIKGYNKKDYQKNKRKRLKYQKEYRRKNPNYISNYTKNKMKSDEDFRVTCYLRNRLNYILKTYTKTGKIMSSRKYGVDYKTIIEHLKPFPKNLSNYEIHHIKPLFTFNFINKDGSTNLKEVKRAFSPENHKLVTIEEHKKIHRNL